MRLPDGFEPLRALRVAGRVLSSLLRGLERQWTTLVRILGSRHWFGTLAE